MKIINRNYLYLYSVVLLLLFVAIFSSFLRVNIKPIFAKDLYFHDESSNSVVGANVYRKFFPPQLRLNPLVDEYNLSDWLEAKYWMHVPPLFAYVPYPLYAIDGQVTIEMKRISYALVTFLTGILFIVIAKIFFKEFKYVFASFVAALLWVFTPYTRDLILGFRFGLSDIVLALSTVIAFAGVAYYFVYLRQKKGFRFWPYLLIGATCALPFCAKSMLGLIPMATMAVVILYDRKGLKKLMYLILGFVLIAGAFYVPLYIESPKIFLFEFMTSFKHFDNYEGWQRPWNIFFSDYLVNNYLLSPANMYIFFGLYALGFTSLFLVKEKPQRNLLIVSGLWLIWNLAVVTIVKSKAPNFIYSTYIFGLFFVVANICIIISYAFAGAKDLLKKINLRAINVLMILILACTTVYAFYCVRGVTKSFAGERSNNVQLTDNAKFYDLAVYGRDNLGWGSDDLVIIDAPSAYWLRFYVMFVSGAEGVHSDQMAEFIAGNISSKNIVMSKYKKVYFVKPSNICSQDPFYIPQDSTKRFNGYTIYTFNAQSLKYYSPKQYTLCD